MRQSRLGHTIMGAAVATALAVAAFTPAHASPTQESSSTSLFHSPTSSRFSEDQSAQHMWRHGPFSDEAHVARNYRQLEGLTFEQRNAARFGPTTLEQAEQCRQKWGYYGPRPDNTQPDCSEEEISEEFYRETLKAALEILPNPGFSLSSLSS